MIGVKYKAYKLTFINTYLTLTHKHYVAIVLTWNCLFTLFRGQFLLVLVKGMHNAQIL